MTKLFALIALASLLPACGAVGTSAAPATLQNQSIAQKFAAFNKNGWSVTGGGIQQPVQQQLPANAVYAKGQSPFANNPFTNPIWHTNFKVDPATSGAASVVTPSGGTGLLGGFSIPGMAAPTVSGQSGQASVTPK